MKNSHWAAKEAKFLVDPRWIEAANFLWQGQLEEKFPVKQTKPEENFQAKRRTNNRYVYVVANPPVNLYECLGSFLASLSVHDRCASIVAKIISDWHFICLMDRSLYDSSFDEELMTRKIIS